MFKVFLSRLDKIAADQPVLLSFLVFVAATLIVVPLSWSYYGTNPQSFFAGVLIEAHGFLFDLLIIGWFAVWLSRRAEKRLRIRRYQEEIEDFLGWESQEAVHRIIGDVRRLNRSGVSKINLRKAHLRGGYLVEMNLKGAMMEGSNLSGANLNNADLREANLNKAQFELTSLVEANLRGATLMATNFKGAYLEDANLQNVNLTEANMTGAYLKRTTLAGADLTNTHFVGAHLEESDLRGAVLDPIQLVRAKTLYGTHLDPAVAETLQASSPALFTPPNG
ncbi:MAG TPA: pentapeptide repeat-containing protein [Rhodothermales bacterium]|nr:pentapeptide repeat-containing protein [Rhodothermales bacterium]